MRGPIVFARLIECAEGSFHGFLRLENVLTLYFSGAFVNCHKCSAGCFVFRILSVVVVDAVSVFVALPSVHACVASSR